MPTAWDQGESPCQAHADRVPPVLIEELVRDRNSPQPEHAAKIATRSGSCFSSSRTPCHRSDLRHPSNQVVFDSLPRVPPSTSDAGCAATQPAPCRLYIAAASSLAKHPGPASARVRGIPSRRVRVPNPVDKSGDEALLEAPDRATRRGRRENMRCSCSCTVLTGARAIRGCGHESVGPATLTVARAPSVLPTNGARRMGSTGT